MRYRIEYQADMHFEEPISEQQIELRLVPRHNGHQKLLTHRLEISPNVPCFEHRDAYGNLVHFFSVVPVHDRWGVHLSAEIENSLENPFDYMMPSPAEERDAIKKFLRENPRHWDFVLPHGAAVPSLSRVKTNLKWPGYDADKNVLDSIQEAMSWIESEFRYETGSTSVHAPLEEVLEKRSGVCQDFAHLLISIVRDWKFAARYVMGYQYMPDDPSGTRAQATHAWAEIYLPGVGWRGFDATHRLLANETYIPVAVGRDSRDAAPERGSFKGKIMGLRPQIKLSLQQQ